MKIHIQLLPSCTGITSETPVLAEPPVATDLVKLIVSHSGFLRKDLMEEQEREKTAQLMEIILQ